LIVTSSGINHRGGENNEKDKDKAFWVPAALFLAVALQLPTRLFAQAGSGRITGVITDSSGGVIPGAEVTIVNAETGRTITATSDSEGRYASVPLPPAVYRLEATHRNDVLDARNFFNKEPAPQAPFLRNQFGGTIGGPIIKNRAFFFFSYDDLRRRESSTLVSTIPTVKMRQGDFSEIQAIIHDPATYDAATKTRQPFPGKVIPVNRFDPIAAQLAELFPDPQNNQLTNNYTLTSSDAEDFKLWNVRIDAHLTQTDTLFYRMNRTLRDVPAVLALPLPLRGGGTDQKDRGWNLGLGWDHTLSPTFLSSTRVGWNQLYFLTGNPAVAGEENVNKIYGINAGDQQVSGAFATFNASGFRSFGGAAFAGTVRDSQNRQVKNDTTVLRGAHTIKFGADVLRQQNLIVQPQRSNGVFTFNGRFTNNPVSQAGGNGFADFLLGIPDQFQLSNVGITTRRGWQVGEYVQDDWRIRPGLTLNVGLRYELILPEPSMMFAEFQEAAVHGIANRTRRTFAWRED